MAVNLSKVSTRALLIALDRCRTDKAEVERIHQVRAEMGEPWMWEWTKEHLDWQKSTSWLGSEVTATELKAELAKREHVPNKPERSELRRQKAKQGRQRGRRDR